MFLPVDLPAGGSLFSCGRIIFLRSFRESFAFCKDGYGTVYYRVVAVDVFVELFHLLGVVDDGGAQTAFKQMA